LIAGLELQGVWLAKGGMAALARAFVDAANQRGVELRTSTHVSHIRLERGATRGVELETGEVMAADVVVFNGDIAALGDGSLGEDVARHFARPQATKRSLSALTVAMTSKTSGFPLREHNVFFDDRSYHQEFDEIFKHRRLPKHPTVYIRAQDRDGGVNPNGQPERLFFIINAPPSGDSSPFSSSEVEPCLQAASDLLSQCGLSIQQSLKEAQRFTPADFHRMFPGTGGALYGQATHSMWAPMRRLSSRTKVPGLYLAGGSIHPGAGVPMAALSGRQAANAILCDWGLTGLCPMAATSGGT
jgi:1-hydroxycarotenoid 3,4-desaturase